VSGSGISWAICKSVPRSRQITMPAPHHSVFYRPISISVFCIFSFSVSGNVTVLPSTVTFMHISVCMQCVLCECCHTANVFVLTYWTSVTVTAVFNFSRELEIMDVYHTFFKIRIVSFCLIFVFNCLAYSASTSCICLLSSVSVAQSST